MRILAIIMVSIIGTASIAALNSNVYEVSQPCSKKNLLRNRSDIPKITEYLTCHKINKKNVKTIDKLDKRKPGFAFDKANEAHFCLAVLEGHREYSEVVFSGSLSHQVNNNRVRKDIEVSGEFLQSPEKTFRGLSHLSVGEVRPDKNSLRLYQEMDVGQQTDIKIDKSNLIAHVNVKDRSENYELDMELGCSR